MDSTEFNQEFWSCLALYHCKGLGPQRWKRLLDFYGDARSAVNNSPSWLKDEVVEPVVFESFHKKQWWENAIQDFEASRKLSAQVLVYSDPNYPKQLKEIPDPPIILYYQGNLDLLQSPCLAIVGSRTCSKYGLDTAGHISHELSASGITIVSGFALGIDSKAHSKSLQAPGKSIAVLGTGLDVFYPYRNNKLRESMQNQGLLLTEFSPGTQPDPRNFPRRNRIISGLSLGVLVIEAGEKSGSLITARYALEQNREVFAVPGPLNLPSYQGCNKLIKQGALLVSSAQDILQELAPVLKHFNHYPQKDTAEENKDKDSHTKAKDKHCSNPDFSNLTAEEQKMARTVWEKGEVHIDVLSRELDLDAGEASKLLLMLEIKGIVKQLPGMYYALVSRD